MRPLVSGYLMLLFFVGAAIKVSAQDLESMKDAKWATIHGSIGGTAYLYSVQRIEPRRVPFSYILSGQTVLSIKGIDIPFSFQFSEQNRSFRQPFNQFGLSPKYKWIKLHLGWRSMNFSNYTMNGYTFLGAGLELTPGKFRFSAMYGRLLKAVPEDTSKQIYNSVSQYPIAAYNRYGYAVKIGVGTERNFFDLIYFKGKDDINSVPANPQIQLVQPGENVAIGIKDRFTFFKHLTLEMDAAASIYSRDLRSDSVAVDDNTLQTVVKYTLTPRLSTNFYYAGDAALQYRAKQFGLGIKYSLVAPDFKTMGTYYMQTDLMRYSFVPYYNSKKNTLQVNGSVGIEQDDIQHKKLAQTNRLINSLAVNYNPKPAYGISLQYSNYGITQQPGLRSLNDTVVLNQVSQSIIAAPHYMLQRTAAVHTFSYVFADQTLNDRNKFESQNFNMTSINNTLSYVLYFVNSGLSIDLSAFYTDTKIAAGISKGIGGSGGIGKTFLKNKINSSINATYSTNSFNDVSDGYTIQVRSTHRANLTKHHHLSLDLTYTNNQSQTQALNKTFNELLTTLMYNYTF